MLLYRMTFYPHGHLDAEKLDTDELHPSTISPFEPLFAPGPSFSGPMPGSPEVTVTWTGSEGGQALLSCSHHDNLFLSGVLVAGKHDASDADILGMFTRSQEALPLLRQITGGRPNPLKALLERPERPLLAGVVWPTLSAEKFAELAGLDVLLSAVFLKRFCSG